MRESGRTLSVARWPLDLSGAFDRRDDPSQFPELASGQAQAIAAKAGADRATILAELLELDEAEQARRADAGAFG